MKIKGTGIKTTRDFIKTRFPEKYNEWLTTLPESSRKIYTDPISISEWYSIKEGYLIPVDKMIEFFFENDVDTGAEALGKYSAETALKGVYKVFLLVATPAFLMKRV